MSGEDQNQTEYDKYVTGKEKKNNSKTPKGNAFQDSKNNIFGFRVIATFILVALLITFGINSITSFYSKSNAVDFSTVIQELKDGKIKSIQQCGNTATIEYLDKSKKTLNTPQTNLVTYLYSKDGLGYSPDTLPVSVKHCEDSLQLDTVVTWIFNIMILVVLGYIAWKILNNLNESGSKIFGFGESKAKFSIGRKQDVSLKDVAGVDEAREELNEIVLFLKEPQRFRKMGARIPKGILMIGAPGTGKTLLARAIAGEAGVPFFSTSGSEFEEMLVGAGASRVRDLFVKAKKVSPSLIFIDEIDAVGKKRGTSINSSATEQTLNQILVEMDGFERSQNVIVIAATNRPDVLDPALLRPGRFDRKITLDLPDQDGRFAILQIHSKDKPMDKDVSLEKIAKRTIGFSGADLENVLNESAISAAKRGATTIKESDIEEATLKVVMGTARKRRRTDKEIDTIAFHEAGHAIVSKFTPESDPVHKITIVSRGMSGGMTMHLPEDDNTLVSRTKMLSEIKVFMGGQIAEKIFMGDITTGASNDIERATSIAQRMVKKYGMTSLGSIEFGNDDSIESYNPVLNYSQKTAEEIDQEVRKLMKDCYAEAEKIIIEHKDKLLVLKNLLRENEIVNSEEFEQLFK